MLGYGIRRESGSSRFLVDATFGVRSWLRLPRLWLTGQYLMNTERLCINATYQAGQSNRCPNLMTVRYVAVGLSFGRDFIKFVGTH